MKMQIDKHNIDKINHEHSQVISSSKQAIGHAIKAGELLTEIKEMLEHGQFISAVENSFEFTRRTAFNYMSCYKYSANVQTLSHLQEAYKYIETEEAKKKRTKEEGQRAKFAYRREYNEKPDTWERADDYAYEKYQKEEADRDKRIAQAKSGMDNEAQSKINTDQEFAQATGYLNDYVKAIGDRKDKLGSLNIINENGDIIEYLADYLANLKTDSQRIEECHNIIKYCKSISVSLQQ